MAPPGPKFTMIELPDLAGTYAVSFTLQQAVKVRIGQLGWFDFLAGEYLYLGSAQGPGGLRARLGRHLRGIGVTRWHIDYLRPHLDIRAVGYLLGSTNLECNWSQSLATLPAACLPAKGFGASDCVRGCPAHLIAFPPGEAPPLAALSVWPIHWILLK
jgi:Uri superfamily endonuclease